MNELPNHITPAERAYWRCLWREHQKQQRIARRVLADLISCKPASRRRVRKEG
jgi:hypothetical protein